MKKIIILSVLMATFGLAMAQELHTYSVYDTNQSGDLTIGDVVGVTDKVVHNVATDKTQQYVTAEDLRALLQGLDTKLSVLEKLSKLDDLEADVAAIKETVNPITPDENGIVTKGHEYVDMGTRGSDGKTVYWATCNVGADAPEDYGNYFAWGETTTKEAYDWNTYKYCNGSEKTMTKYCTQTAYGTVDNKIVLDPEDDAASANWGGSWRMPTQEEMELLVNQCYWEWTVNYNGKKVSGYVVYKAKADADKGKHPSSFLNDVTVPTPEATYSVSSDVHIFLPAAGYHGNSIDNDGSNGCYWSSSLGNITSAGSCGFYLNAGKVDYGSGYQNRPYGHSVRAVCK